MNLSLPELIFAPAEAMPERAAAILLNAAVEAVALRGIFTLALSGGSSPLPLFRLLRGEQWRVRFPWSRTRVFFADERCVPPDHTLSNYGMIQRELLAYVPVGEVFRMRGEDDPESAAARYAAEFAAQTPHGLDCAVLGMGADGHTASLFPYAAVLQDPASVATTVRPDATRITLGKTVLDAAALALFYVSGADKAERVLELCGEAPLSAEAFPAAHIRATRRVWVLDEGLCPA